MPSTIESPYTPEQIKVWFRGLLTIAWADGHFDEEEKSLITSMTQEEFAPNIDFLMRLNPLPPKIWRTSWVNKRKLPKISCVRR